MTQPRRAKPRTVHNGPRVADGTDLRCGCGKLVARLTPYGVEVQCRHCKRLVLIPLQHGKPRAPT
jgi:hypothetical protein